MISTVHRRLARAARVGLAGVVAVGVFPGLGAAAQDSPAPADPPPVAVPAPDPVPVALPNEVILRVDVPVASEKAPSAAGVGVGITASFPDGSGVLSEDTSVSVSVGAAGDSALGSADGSGADYANVESFTMVIPAGESSVAVEEGFVLRVTDDDLAEGFETLTVAGSTTAAGIDRVSGAVITIVDDDGLVTLTVDPERAAEGAATGVAASAELPAGVVAEREVTVSASVGAEGDGATGSADGSGADYKQVADFEIVIPAGAGRGAGSFTLETTDDETADEGEESVTVSGAVTSAEGFAVTSATMLIVDGDEAEDAEEDKPGLAAVADVVEHQTSAPDKVVLTADVSEAEEGAAAAPTVTVTAAFPDGTTALSSAVTVSVSVGKTGDTATGSADGSGADYTDVSDFDLVIPAGSSSVAHAGFTLTVTDDMLAEGDETLTITGSTSAVGITAVEEAVITITDDADSTVTLTVDSDPDPNTTSDEVREVRTVLSVAAALPSGITAARVLPVYLGLGAEGDEAVGSETGAGADYRTIGPFDVGYDIPAGESGFASELLVLQATDDNLAGEGQPNANNRFRESVTVTGRTLARPSLTGIAGFTVASDVIYIVDDDRIPAVGLSVNPARVGEGDGTVTITVTAAYAASALQVVQDVTVILIPGAADDTATDSADGTGADYATPTISNITIASWEKTGQRTFDLSITNDSISEGDHSLTLNGAVSASGAPLSEPKTEITITDDDDLITLTLSSSSLGEDSGTTSVTVTAALPTAVSAPMGGITVSVTMGKSGDSATGAGTDYADLTIADFTIAEGASSASSAAQSVTITQDDLAEGDEVITFTGTASSTYQKVAEAVLTITDDDDDITLSVNPASVTEAGGVTNVTVTGALAMNKTAAADLTVVVSVGKDGDTATGSGTGAGADYVNVDDFELEIAAGGTQGTSDFNLWVTDDPDWEGSETQTVTLVGTLTSFTINEPAITITDDNDLNPASCGDGTYVDNPATQTGLASDCRALIIIRNHWVSSAPNYDWPADHPVLEWGTGAAVKIDNWEGVTVTDTDPGAPEVKRVTKLEMLDETVAGIADDLRRPGLDVSGILPAAIGDLTALENLLLNNNRLVGSIPTEIGALVNLEKLYLHGNLLFGVLPAELGSLTSLTELLVTDNLLRGGIPSELGSLTNLTKLWLDDNLLSGTIPTQLGNLSNLEELHLHQNQLSGTIPTQLGNLANLKELILSDNFSTRYILTLSGTVTRVYNSGLLGSIPKELGRLSNLEKLHLDDNYLSGAIPAELGRLNQLKELWLEDNLLSGAVPTELGNLASLVGMDLEENQLTSIPDSLGDLSNLQYLLLGNNRLSSVPAGLGDLGNLQTLVLSGNRLTGPLPAELGELAPSEGGSLSTFYIHNPGPLGPIPAPLLGVNWVDLFAYDDPLDLITFYEFTSGLGTSPRTYEIWTCDVGDIYNITPQAAATLLNNQVTEFFKDMSGDLFAPTFQVGGAVTSTPTRAAGGIDAARKSCRDQIRPNRDKQGEHHDPDRKMIIIDNSNLREGFMQQYLRLGIPPNTASDSPGYQKLTTDSVIQVGGGTVLLTNRGVPRIGTVAHEIGHDIQWPHSYGGNILLAGEVHQYDNLMDLMSGRITQGLASGTIAVNRYSAGWIEPEEVAVHTGAAATYELHPAGEDGTQMLVIPTAWGPGVFFTLGVRVQEDFDSDIPLEGVELYLVDQRRNACTSSFAGVCGNTRRRISPINAPGLISIGSSRICCTVENVWNVDNTPFFLPVGVAQNLRVNVTGRDEDNNKFTVSVAALPFTPVSSRSILGLPERMVVSVNPSGSGRTVREGQSPTVSVTVAYPPGSRTSRYDAEALVSVGGTAEPGSDYRRVGDFAITIPAGASRASRSFRLQVNSDSQQEGAETITLSVRAPGYTVSGQQQVTFTIPANDEPQPPTPSPGGGGGGGGGSPSPPPTPSAPPPTQPVQPPEPAFAGRFSDEDGSVHEASVEMIAGWGITVGCDASDPALFCPSQSITRRQMSAFLYRAVVHRWGTPEAAERAAAEDVGDEAWYRVFADWAVENGVMEVVDGLFNPGGVVTRSDMAVMLVAAFPHLAAVEEAQDLFGDLEGADERVVRAVEGLYGLGVTKGCTDSPLRYCPDQPVTRAQMASFFVRALNQAPDPVTP